MPSFETQGQVLLQPFTQVGFDYEITICSSSTANDGFIPYGTTVSSVNVIAYDKDEEVVTGELIHGTPTISENVITTPLKYPETSGDGRYKLTFQLTLSDSSKVEADFDRVVARNS